MNSLPLKLLAASLLTVALAGCNTDEKPQEVAAPTPAPATAPEQPLSVTDTVEVNVTSKVKMVDHANRIMTLEDEDGHRMTFRVDPSVRRLHEVMAGDEVKARYKATLLAELRPPTPGETAEPIAIIEVSGRSPQGSTPAAGSAQAVRVVTTVEAVDVPNMRVTLRGPMGDLAVVKGRNPDNVKRLRVGDTIVITFTESVAIALDKVAPR